MKNYFEYQDGGMVANLTNEDLVDEIIEVEDNERIENFSNTIYFIKNGGTKFIK